MASLFTRKSRFYAAFYDAERRPKQKQLSLKTSDERAARRLLLDLEEAFEEGAWNPWDFSLEDFLNEGAPEELTGAAAVDAFLDAKKREGCASSTVRTYRYCLRPFLREQRLTQAPVTAIERRHVSAYVRDGEVSRTTQRKRYRHVRAFLRWLVKEEHLDASPTRKMKPPKRAGKAPKRIRWSELEAIQNEAPSWFAQMLQFATVTGLRASELGRLRWDDVDFSGGLIRISAKQKNRREQTIPLVDAARSVLEEIGPSEGLIFNAEGRRTRLWVNYVGRLFRTYRKRAGVREAVSLHSCRHATASFLAEKGKSAMTIQAYMRHSSPVISSRYVALANRELASHVNDVF